MRTGLLDRTGGLVGRCGCSVNWGDEVGRKMVDGDVHVVCVYGLESQQERGLTW
jgi:hypothetical protein